MRKCAKHSEFRPGKVQNLLVIGENIMDVPQNQGFTISAVYLNQWNQVSGKAAKALTFEKSEENEHEICHKWMHFSSFHLCFALGSLRPVTAWGRGELFESTVGWCHWQLRQQPGQRVCLWVISGDLLSSMAGRVWAWSAELWRTDPHRVACSWAHDCGHHAPRFRWFSPCLCAP